MLRKILIILIITNTFSCGFQAAYKEINNSESQNFSYENELAAIRIKKDRTKLDQDLKNNIYDLLNPDNIAAEPKYFLILKAKKIISSTFTTATGSSGRNKIYLDVSYELKDLTTAETISTGQTIVNDNYDVTSNRFGTYSADEYVQLNITKVAAQNIRNSLINDLVELKKKKEKQALKELQEKKELEELEQRKKEKLKRTCYKSHC
ncbi:MAG: hypothetical protein KGQ36_04530 [Rickettsiales bacterium]|nr:hypothetical protein [Rickettsiales bacterium]